MISAQENDELTRTGAGTLMGDLFRRYWMPALHASEIAQPDCPPVRVKLLGESLVCFRDSKGDIGLVDEFCAHRGVSLWFGRNEECGLRCPYHGWKYDVSGQCVDLPSEGADGPMRKRIKPEGIEPGRMSAAEFTAFVAEELKRWTPVVKASGATND